MRDAEYLLEISRRIDRELPLYSKELTQFMLGSRRPHVFAVLSKPSSVLELLAEKSLSPLQRRNIEEFGAMRIKAYCYYTCVFDQRYESGIS